MDITKGNDIIVEQLDGLSNNQQVEAIATAFSEISNQYDHIEYSKLQFTHMTSNHLRRTPSIEAHELVKILEKIKTNKVLGWPSANDQHM